MKRIALVIDNSKRDLVGIANVAYWLIRNHGVRPIIVGTQNEITALVKYVPHLLVMPHVRFERHGPVLAYAKAQGTRIAVIPVEGLPATDRLLPKKVLGREDYRKDVDLLLSWGEYVASYCRDKAIVPTAAIQVTGCPRFDVNTRAYDSWFTSRTDFLRKLNLPSDRPVMTWFSCTAWANMAVPEEVFAQSLKDPRRSATLVGDDFDLLALRRDDQKAFDFMMDLFLRYVGEHPEYNYLVKPHPQEPNEPYRTRLGTLLSSVRVLDASYQAAEVIRHSDIQINWQCTTSLEGWMFDIRKKTISIRPPGLQLKEDYVPFVNGNDCVNTYEEFVQRVDHYLNGGALPTGLEQKREEFIRRYAALSGHSGETCARVLVEHLDGHPEPRRRWRNLRYIASQQIPHWIRHRYWVMVRRTPDHSKYLSPDLFQHTIDQYNRLFSTTISPKDYRLEV